MRILKEVVGGNFAQLILEVQGILTLMLGRDLHNLCDFSSSITSLEKIDVNSGLLFEINSELVLTDAIHLMCEVTDWLQLQAKVH